MKKLFMLVAMLIAIACVANARGFDNTGRCGQLLSLMGTEWTCGYHPECCPNAVLKNICKILPDSCK